MRRRLALSLSVLLLSGCAETPAAPQSVTPTDIPDGHPCPQSALPPEFSSLYEEHILSGTPVPIALLPPLDIGFITTVTQGNQMDPTHQGKQAYAWDFFAPVGTSVHAAAPGFVVWVREDSQEHGQDESFSDKANWIVVDHGAGLYTAYVHLAAQSARVVPGQAVEAGTHLADTGLSGQLTGPHLHFHVENVWSDTLPATFIHAEASSGCSRAALLGDELARGDELRELLVGPDSASELPRRTFAQAGVTQIEGLPARVFHRGEAYEFRGQTEPGHTAVALMIFPEGGGDVVHGVSVPVIDGAFEGDLELSSLAAGQYGWAMVATTGEVPSSPWAIWLTVIDD
jgi:hypothetical protein